VEYAECDEEVPALPVLSSQFTVFRDQRSGIGELGPGYGVWGPGKKEQESRIAKIKLDIDR
jgi:hypothetical protein